MFTTAEAAVAKAATDGKPRPEGRLPHRLDWFDATGDGDNWWLEVRDLERRPVAGFVVHVVPTRALPGHRIVRLERLRFAPDPGPAEAAVRFLVGLAHRDGRTLSLTVETFFADDAEKAHGRDVLEGLGFLPATWARSYRRTVRIDLAPEPEQLLSSFHANARRHIRAVAKRPVELRLVDDPDVAPRLAEILSETFSRTSEPAPQEPWRALIAYAREHPELARLVSLVRTDRSGPEALVAFALGLNHGDHVQYSVAGSTRPPDLRMPLGYALAWDLMGWARTLGMPWFDFGGIAPDATPDDMRRGIYAFKRNFGNEIVEVGQAWTYEASPARGGWVRAVSVVAEELREFWWSRSLGRRTAAESESAPAAEDPPAPQDRGEPHG